MEATTLIQSQPITVKEVRANPKVKILVEAANEVMKAIGYTEHGQRHVGVVSSITRYILEQIGESKREVELGQIAGYLHDIGNAVNRINHPITSAQMAMALLAEMGMEMSEIVKIIGAIGNHEELEGAPINTMSAALIIADKSDVHFTRVQNPIQDSFDIHDRVNYAVQKSRVEVRPEDRVIELTLEIDTTYASVMEYFEIFIDRMVMCRRSADLLGHKFTLRVNGTVLE